MASIRNVHQVRVFFFLCLYMICSVCGANGHNSRHHHGHCSLCGEKGHNRRKCRKRPSEDTQGQTTKYCKVFNEHIGNEGKELSQSSIDLVCTVAVRLLDENSNATDHAVTERLAFLTGYSYGCVRSLILQLKDGAWPVKRQKGLKRTKNTIYDREIISAIHQSIEHLAKKGIFPTAQKVVRNLSFYKGVIISRSKLRRIMKAIGFEFRKSKSGHFFVDQTKEIIDWRLKYCRELKKLRDNEGFYPVYIDETYVNENHVFNKGWFYNGLTVKQKSGKGNRWILFHAGGANGWVQWKYKLFTAKKTADYHDSMNGKHFMEIFEELAKECQTIGKCVFIADNASYHKEVVNQECRKTYWTKTKAAQLKEMWLKGEIPGQLEMPCPKTAKAIREVIFANMPNGELKMSSIAAKYGHKVIFLPPYHPQLNPIEMAWALVKNYVANNNINHTFKMLKFLIEKGIDLVLKKQWEGLVKKARTWEDWYLFQGTHKEDEMEKFKRENPSLVFSVGDSSDSEDEDAEIENHDIPSSECISISEAISEDIDNDSDAYDLD
ncbi:Hypothetical predicted protein [Mytilus galloprovincialis]|uniref:CCHC-type domain-containing protein n=1 Tax=Mytilus galloprovincialis TaxID=29158 RepID=A0A8B6EUU2_MYTGA|nr:Hypothetical predicted protein [Mytilus galloprovincialis]